MGKRALTPDEIQIFREAGQEVPTNAVVDDGIPPKETTDGGGFWNTAKDVPGIAYRQTVSSAIPMAVGGVGGGATTGALAGLGFGPIGAGIGGLIGMAASAYGAKKLQDKALKAYSEANPESDMARFVQKSEEDVQKHPVISALAGLPASKFAGGTLLPNIANITRAPAQAAKMAGAAGAVNLATQQLAEPGSPVDIPALLASSIGGTAFGGPLSGHNNPPGKISSALSPEALNAGATAGGAKLGMGIKPSSGPLIPAADLAGMSSDALKLVSGKASGWQADFYRAISADKNAGVEYTPAEIDAALKLAPNQGAANALMTVKAQKIPASDLAAQKVAENEAAYQERLKASLAANQVKQVPQVEDRTTSVTETGTSAPQQALPATKARAETIKTLTEPAVQAETVAAAERQKGIDESLARAQELTRAGAKSPAQESAEAIQQAELPTKVPTLDEYKKSLRHYNELSKIAAAETDGAVKQNMNQRLSELRGELSTMEGQLFAPKSVIKPVEEVPPNEPTEATPPPAPPTAPAGETPTTQPTPGTPVVPKGPEVTGAAEGTGVSIGDKMVAELKAAQAAKTATSTTVAKPTEVAPTETPEQYLEKQRALKYAAQDAQKVLYEAAKKQGSVAPAVTPKKGRVLGSQGKEPPKSTTTSALPASNVEELPPSRAAQQVTEEFSGAGARPVQAESSALGPNEVRLGEHIYQKREDGWYNQTLGVKVGHPPLETTLNKALGIEPPAPKPVENPIKPISAPEVPKVVDINGTLFEKTSEGWTNKKTNKPVSDVNLSDILDNKLRENAKSLIEAPNKGLKGGQSGSVLDFFPSQQKADELKAKTSSALGSLNIKKKVDTAIGGEIKKVLPGTELGTHIEKQYDAMRIERNAISGRLQNILIKAKQDTTRADRIKASDYLRDLEEKGESDIILTPEQQRFAEGIQKIRDTTGAEGQAGAFVHATDEAGRPIERPRDLIPNYLPSGFSREDAAILRNPSLDQGRYAEIKDLFMKHYLKRVGGSADDAEKAFASRQSPSYQIESSPNPTFRGLRIQEGIGLPRELQNPDISETMASYIERHATDMAFHRYMESDPAIALATGAESMGRNNPPPKEVVLPGGEKVTYGSLRGNEPLKRSMQDYLGGIDPASQRAEAVQGLVHSAKLGPATQIWNHFQNAGALGEVMTPAELKEYPLEAWKRLVDPANMERAIESGSVRPARNLQQTVATDVDSYLTKLQDAIGKYSGSEFLSKHDSLWLDLNGRMVAKNRIAQGDTKFLDEWGPPKWKDKNLDEVVDFVAAKFVRHFAGAYDATQLPGPLLRGSNAPFAPIWKLARWSVERYNKWNKVALQPAMRGEVGPLIRSLTGGMLAAGVINKLKEEITNRKPKELTWAEYLKLGGKDTAYTLASKAATASIGGLASDIPFMALQLANKEAYRSYNNLMLQTVSDAMTRAGQFVNAWSAGDVDFGEGLAKLGLAIAQDNIQVLRMVTKIKEDDGKREERIAQRLDYMPKAGTFTNPSLDDPFSEAAAYRNEDTSALGRIFQRKLSEGRPPSSPDSEIRQSMKYQPSGELTGYYDFIRKAQGDEAANKAFERDYNSTIKKRGLYTSALAGGGK